MKLAVVTPRFGAEVVGGAETAARLLATALVRHLGWDVEILTTTAIDTNWNDGFDPGTTALDDLVVRRFPVRGRRTDRFDDLSSRIFPAPRRATHADEVAWVDAQGPVSDELIDAIASTDADVVAFHPYLYHPTIVGRAAAKVPTMLHGAAHDEPPLQLGIIRQLFESVDGHAFWSDAERSVASRFAIGSIPQAVIGLGVETQPGTVDAARLAVGLDDRPYVVCLGRVDDGKGAALLARLFAEYADRNDDDVVLVFVGPVVDPPPQHPRVVVAGRVDESVKWGLLRGAIALVSPSAYESFGIVLGEAWLAGRPVLVNERCAVTRDHVGASGGGLTFTNGATFASALHRLIHDPAVANALGAAGQAYAGERFTWERTVERYRRLVDAVRRRAADHLIE